MVKDGVGMDSAGLNVGIGGGWAVVDMTESVYPALRFPLLSSSRFEAVRGDLAPLGTNGFWKKESSTLYRYWLSATPSSSTSVYDCSCELFAVRCLNGPKGNKLLTM